MFQHPVLLTAKRGPLKTSVSRKTIFSDDTSCVNLIVAWNELAKSMKWSLPEDRFLWASC